MNESRDVENPLRCRGLTKRTTLGETLPFDYTQGKLTALRVKAVIRELEIRELERKRAGMNESRDVGNPLRCRGLTKRKTLGFAQG